MWIVWNIIIIILKVNKNSKNLFYSSTLYVQEYSLALSMSKYKLLKECLTIFSIICLSNQAYLISVYCLSGVVGMLSGALLSMHNSLEQASLRW